MKTKYPIEAFALAMIVFSTNVQVALITGILIIFITTLGMVIMDLFHKFLPKWSANISGTMLILAMNYAAYIIVMNGILNMNVKQNAVLAQLAIGILIVKHILTARTNDYNAMLFELAIAYGALLMISFIREFIAVGSIYGNKIADFNFMTSGFGDVAFGLMFAGIAIAILNKVLGYTSEKLMSLVIALPVIVLYEPFVINNIPWGVNALLAVVIAMVLLVSVSIHLKFSTISKKWRNLPIELISLSFIYMILNAI